MEIVILEDLYQGWSDWSEKCIIFHVQHWIWYEFFVYFTYKLILFSRLTPRFLLHFHKCLKENAIG